MTTKSETGTSNTSDIPNGPAPPGAPGVLSHELFQVSECGLSGKGKVIEGLEHEGEGQRKWAEVLLRQEEGKIMLICNSLD